MRPVHRSLALVALVTVLASQVVAQDDASTAAARAEAAEDAASPREALEAWGDVVRAAPTSRLASRARTRIAWITERREGDYAPLAAMMRFLDLSSVERDASVVRAFTHDVDAMPAGHVRAESRVAIAGEWQRLGETDRALAAWHVALDDPDLDVGERDLIRESMARARLDAGDPEGALDELDDAELEGTDLERMAARRIRVTRYVPIASGIAIAFALLVVIVVARSGRALALVSSLRDAPLRPLIALVVGTGPLVIVRWWGDDSLAAFSAFAPWSVFVVLGSFVAGEATESLRSRGALAVMAVAAALAGAYVAVALYGQALPFA